MITEKENMSEKEEKEIVSYMKSIKVKEKTK